MEERGVRNDREQGGNDGERGGNDGERGGEPPGETFTT